MPQLLDQFGRAIPPLKRPETREIASVSLKDRWSSYPSAGLTPGRLSAIFRQADQGDLWAQAELFEEMEEKDAHLAAVLQTRRLAVLGLEYQVEDASEDAEDQKIGELCREQVETLDMDDLLTHLLGAVGQGYAAAELLWDNQGQARIKGFNLIHPKNITFVNSLMPLVSTEANWQGEAPPAWKLVYHRAAAKCGHDTRNGVLRVCAYMYLFKNYSLKDWVVFNEIFGMPLRLGKYEPSATPADREALRSAISSLGSDAAGIISKSTEIEFVEAAGRLSGITNPYQVMAFFCNREISKAVLGQTLTTDTEGSTGTFSAGKVQEGVRRDLLEADCKSLAKTIRLQMLRPLVGFNFGWDKAVPGFHFNIAEDEDLKALSETYKNLSEMGYPITVKHISERFGIPEPEKDDLLITPLPKPQPPGQPGPAPGGRPAAMKAVLPLRTAGGDTHPAELELIPQDGKVIATQQELEALSQAALAASAEAAARMLAPVKGLIEAGKSLEEIRGGLIDAYGAMPVDELAELLYQARMLAYMKGRANE